MKKILTILLSGVIGLNLMAQADAEAKAQINKIKRSKSYLSAEATMQTEEEAKSLALEMLVAEINDWVAEKRNGGNVKQVVLQDINSNTQQMDMKRGTRTRVFVYVKKKDIVLIYGEGQIVLNDEELQPLASFTSSASSDTRIEDTPIEKDSVQTETSVQKKNDNPLQKIMNTRTMADMKPVFAELKETGKITYGTYKSEELRDNCYLLFYSRTGEIKAVVHKQGETLTDAASGDAAELSDYSGLGAYWFVLD